MTSVKEKQRRIKALLALKVSYETSSRDMSEMEIRNIIEEYMLSTWYLGYVTRHDYLKILFR